MQHLRKRNEELKEQNNKILRQKKQFQLVVFLALAILGCGIGLFFLNDNLNMTKSELADANNTISIRNDTLESKNNQISSLCRDVHNLNVSLREEIERREEVENDYESFKNSLKNMQPFIVKSTSFNFSSGWLSFDYYGLRDTTVTVQVKAFGNYAYSNSSSIDIEKGYHSNSIYLSSGLNSSDWYSFEMLVGNKIIGGD